MAATRRGSSSNRSDLVVSVFGIVNDWMSDRGSHFKNELIQSISESLKSSHHFTLAYCPRSNGTVEVVMRELLRASRALLSEFQLPNIADLVYYL